jgi:hypothetical protein
MAACAEHHYYRVYDPYYRLTLHRHAPFLWYKNKIFVVSVRKNPHNPAEKLEQIRSWPFDAYQIQRSSRDWTQHLTGGSERE